MPTKDHDNRSVRNQKTSFSTHSVEEMKSVNFSPSTSGSFSESNTGNISAQNGLSALAPWLEEERTLLPHQEAAILMQYARDGQELDISDLTTRSRLCYRLRRKYHVIFRIAAWSLLLIHVFERPVWTFSIHDNDWADGAIYPSFQMSYMPLAVSTFLTAVVVAVLWVGVMMEFGFKKGHNKRNYLTILFAVVLSIKSVAVLMNIVNVCINRDPVLSTSPVEALCILLVEYRYENNMGYLFRTIPKFSMLMVVLAGVVCAYTALAFLIFDPTTNEATQYFNFYGSAVWNMLMVLNGSNWPPPMMPAFQTNRLYCIYFFIYIVLCDWGLLNLVLGFVYLFFKLEQRAIVTKHEEIKQSNYLIAFRVLDKEEKGFLNYHQVDALLEELFVFYEETTHIPTAEERYELILELDAQANGIVDEHDFYNIEEKCFGPALKIQRAKKNKFKRYLSAAVVTNSVRNSVAEPSGGNNMLGFARSSSLFGGITSPLMSRNPTLQGGTGTVNVHDLDKVTNKDLAFQRAVSEASVYGNIHNMHIIERYNRNIEQSGQGNIAGKPASKNMFSCSLSEVASNLYAYCSYLAMLMDSTSFDIFFDTIVFVLGVIFLSETRPDDFFYAYLVFVLAEALMKLVIKGRYRYVKSTRHCADGAMALILLCVCIGRNVNDLPGDYYGDFGIKVVILVRLFLYPRNILATDRFKAFRHRHRLAFEYAFRGAGHFSFLLVVMFAFMYGFAALGQQFFGGVIVKTGDNGAKIEASMFGQYGYWPLNFNDMPSGFVTMFVLLHVNNMHVTASGFMAIHGEWCELFFAAWYALGVLLMLNVLTAVFLNEFTGYLERLAVERHKAEEAALKDSLAVQLTGSESDSMTSSRSQSVHNQDLSSNSDSYVGMSSINRALLLQLEQDQRAANAAQEQQQQPYDPNHSLMGRSLFDRMFYWGSPSKGEGENSGANTNRNSSSHHSGNINVNHLLVRNDTVQSNQSYVSSINNSQGKYSSSMNMPIQRKYTNNPTPSATIEPVDKASRFDSSIFASNSGRQRLEAWISSYYPQKKATKPVKRKSGGNLFAFARSLSLTAGLLSESHQQDNVHPSPGSPDGDTSSPESAKRDEEKCNSGDELLVSQTSQTSQTSHSSAGQNSQGHLTALGKLPSNLSANSLKKHGRRGSHNSHSKHGGKGSHQRKRKQPKIFTARNLDGADSDSSSGDDPESDIVVDLNVSGDHAYFEHMQQNFGANYRSTNNSVALDDPQLNPLQNTVGDGFISNETSSNASNMNSAMLNELVDELQVNTEFNAAVTRDRVKSINLHEKNIMKNLSSHHITPRKPKKSVLKWMYGLNQLSNHEKAAVLIQFARDGEEHSIFSSERSLVCYRYRSKLSHLFRFVSFLYAFLKFFERPVWTYSHSQWQDDSIYPVSGIPLMGPTLTIALKIPLLLVMLGGLVLELGYKEASLRGIIQHLTPMRLCRCVLTLYCVVQILILFYCITVSGEESRLVTITSAGCILYVLWFNRKSLGKFKIVAQILPRLSMVLVIFLGVVLVFAGFGPFIFQAEDADDYNNQSYFGTFADAVWSVFVAITSSNYPSQVMPAYQDAREVFIYFFTFICIGAFGLLNVIIVIVLVEFQKASQLHTDYQKASRQILLMRAFEILDEDGVGYLEKSCVKLLLDELYLHYSDFQKAGIPQGYARNILLDILDIDGDGMISVDDFLFFLDVTRIKLSLDTRRTFLEKNYPFIVNSALFAALKSLVNNQYFDVAVDSLVAVLITCSLVINQNNLYKSTKYSFVFTVSILVVFTLELASKLLVKGYTKYIRSFRNKVDLCVSLPMLVLWIGGMIYTNVSADNVNGFTICIRILQMIRVIIFPRNLRYVMYSKGLLKLSRLLRRVFAKIYTLGLVFLCVGYVFATVGMFFYGGLMNKSPDYEYYDALQATSYAKQGFYALNFNDFVSSCITLFTCLHVSDFDVISGGFSAVTSDYTRIYFTGWYVIGVLLMLNIVKSFFLGEFLNLFATSKGLESGSGFFNPHKKSVDGNDPKNRNDSEDSHHSHHSHNKHHGKGTKLTSANTNTHLRRRLIDRLNFTSSGPHSESSVSGSDSTNTHSGAGSRNNSRPTSIDHIQSAITMQALNPLQTINSSGHSVSHITNAISRPHGNSIHITAPGPSSALAAPDSTPITTTTTSTVSPLPSDTPPILEVEAQKRRSSFEIEHSEPLTAAAVNATISSKLPPSTSSSNLTSLLAAQQSQSGIHHGVQSSPSQHNHHSPPSHSKHRESIDETFLVAVSASTLAVSDSHSSSSRSNSTSQHNSPFVRRTTHDIPIMHTTDGSFSVRESDSTAHDMSYSQNLGHEDAHQVAGTPIRYHVSTSNIKDLDKTGRDALKNRLRDLTMGL